MTQREAVLMALKDGRWHTIADFGAAAYTGRNRIAELRKAGVPIEGRKRAGSRLWEYRWAGVSDA